MGCGNEVKLKYFIKLIEKYTHKKAIIRKKSFQKGDVHKTLANISNSGDELGYNPKTKVEEGIKKFIDWYVKYYSSK